MNIPIEQSTNPELFAKILGTPLAIAEKIVNHYDGDLTKIGKKLATSD